MDYSAIKRDKYMLGPAMMLGVRKPDVHGVICIAGNGDLLFKVAGNPQNPGDRQFIGTDGKQIGEVKKDPQSGFFQIFDDSSTPIGVMGFGQGRAVLNDSTNTTIATALMGSDKGNFNITTPDGNTNLAAVEMQTEEQAPAQQNQQAQAGAQQGAGLVAGQPNPQKAHQRTKFTVSINNQTINPMLMLAFVLYAPRILGFAGRRGTGGMLGMRRLGFFGARMAFRGFGGLGGFGRI